MNDPILASDQAISRGLAHFLTPPDDAPEFCKECGDEKPCTNCIRCAWCGETREDCTGDCENGHSDRCDRSGRYIDGVLTRATCNCMAVWEEHEARWERAKASAEEQHLEEGRDHDRGLDD